MAVLAVEDRAVGLVLLLDDLDPVHIHAVVTAPPDRDYFAGARLCISLVSDI